MSKFVFSFLLFCIIWRPVFADSPALAAPPGEPSAADLEKKRAANWPAVFAQAGNEFGVPADILASISFNTTHWEHLTWPDGEADPHFMPHQYGIMGLWENDVFGHQLSEAAQLIGKSPADLKADPIANIRGAAALLKKLYSDTPLPEGTQSGELESWRNAIAKFSGFPERDLSQSFALGVFEEMAKGSEEYGWKSHPVHLEPMREIVSRINEEESKKREEKALADENNAAPSNAPANTISPATTLEQKAVSLLHKPTAATPSETPPAPGKQTPSIMIVIAVVAGLGLGWMFLARSRK